LPRLGLDRVGSIHRPYDCAIASVPL